MLNWDVTSGDDCIAIKGVSRRVLFLSVLAEDYFRTLHTSQFEIWFVAAVRVSRLAHLGNMPTWFVSLFDSSAFLQAK